MVKQSERQYLLIMVIVLFFLKQNDLQVTEMKKEKTALVIPNAVQVGSGIFLTQCSVVINSGLRWNRQVFLHVLCRQGQDLCDAF